MDYETERLDKFDAAHATRYVMGSVKMPEKPKPEPIDDPSVNEMADTEMAPSQSDSDIGTGLLAGVRGGIQGIVDAGTEFLTAGGEDFLKQSGLGYADGSDIKLNIPAPQLPEVKQPQSAIGEITRDLTQFITVFAAQPNKFKGMGKGAELAGNMFRGAVADASFDPTGDFELGIVQGLVDLGALPQAFEYLAADVTDESSAEEKLIGRLNLAVEGGVIGAGVDGLIKALKAIKNSPAAKRALATTALVATGATISGDAESAPFKTIIKRLSNMENNLINEAATKDGVLDKKTAAAVKKEALRIKNAYPQSDGWLPIGVNPGGTAPAFKIDDKGNITIKWQQPSYQFDKPPGYVNSKKKPKPDEVAAHKATMVDTMVNDVQAVVDRALAGDEAAIEIINQANWYRSMRTRLRQEFGGMADVFADVIGATSAQTGVQQNYDNALIVLRRFTRGEFDDEIAAYQKILDEGGSLSQKELTAMHKDPNSPFKLITKASGALFNTNSPAATAALLDMFRQIKVGQAPKTINFTGNLIGYGNDATIDVWAARYLRDAAGLPRIPPPVEKAVSGNHLTGSTIDNPKIGAEFGFGQEVFAEAAERINASGMISDVNSDLGALGADDLQAVVWFLEKEKWTKNGWTSKTGEGGSLDFESEFGGSPDRGRVAELRSIINRKGATAEEIAEAEAELATLQGEPQRLVAGVSRERPNMRPTNVEQAELAAELTAPLKGDDTVIGYQANNTYGEFMGDAERALNFEVTTQTNFNPTAMTQALVEAGRKYDQDAVFISKVVPAGTAGARPGIEVYFRDRQGADYAQRITAILREKGIDGFTFITDARQMDRVDVQAAGTDDVAGLVGIRFQYIPEFDDAFDTARAEDIFQEKSKLFRSVLNDIGTIDGITYADVVYYDTQVFKNTDREGAEWINGGTSYEEHLGGAAGGRAEGLTGSGDIRSEAATQADSG
jgi:hypothetical protein